MRSWRLIWRTDGIVPYLAAPASFKRLLGGERTARQFNKRRAGGALRDPLLGEAELLHEVAAIPEQPLVIHAPVDPVANGYHPDCEALASGGYARSIREGHGPCKGASHDAGDRRPGARAEANRVHFDCDARGVDEERLQILDVLVDPSCLMTVWPGDDDVLRVTLLEPVPLLITKDVEVEDIERLEVGFNGGRLNLGLRRRDLRTLSWRLLRYGRVWHAKRRGRDRHKGEVTIDDGTHGKSSLQYHGPGVSCFRGELPNGSRLSCGRRTRRGKGVGRPSVPARAQHPVSARAMTARQPQAWRGPRSGCWHSRNPQRRPAMRPNTQQP